MHTKKYHIHLVRHKNDLSIILPNSHLESTHVLTTLNKVDKMEYFNRKEITIEVMLNP